MTTAQELAAENPANNPKLEWSKQMVDLKFNTNDLLPACQCAYGCVCENPADCPQGEGCECYRESQVDDLADSHIRRSIADRLGSEEGWTIIRNEGPYTIVRLCSSGYADYCHQAK